MISSVSTAAMALFGEWLDFDEPLRREARLDDGSGAIAFAERYRVVLRSDQKALSGEVFDHASARCETLKAGIRPGIGVHLIVFVDDFDLRKVVAKSRLEVVGVVRWRDFHGARTKLGLCKVVGDDRDFTIHQREQNFFAVKMRIALVLRIHGNGSIAEHGFRTRGGDCDEFVAANDWVADFVELAGHVLVFHFEIGDGRAAVGTPVHDVLAAIDEALFVEADEDFAHSAREILVHGEVFASPVDGDTETLHLVEDGAAVETLPFPDAFDEFLAAHFESRFAFAAELAVHHHLGGDARVVGTGKPKGDEAAHAMPAHDDVHLRLVEHVAHVESTGDVRRRQEQSENGALVVRRGGRSVEEFLANPEVGPAGFNSAGFVRFGQFVWHEIGITGEAVTKNVIFYLTGEESSQSGAGGRLGKISAL